MINNVKVVATWLILFGHVLFGFWLKNKLSKANDSIALRSGQKAERKAPNNVDELKNALDKGDL